MATSIRMSPKSPCNRPWHDVFLAEISSALGTPLHLLDLDASFIQNGGDSFRSIRLGAALSEHGVDVSVFVILSTKTLRSLLADGVSKHTSVERALRSAIGAAERARPDMSEPPHKRARRDTKVQTGGYPMTEMQTCLVASTLSSPRQNIISYYEVHRPDAVAVLRSAWAAVLRAEPIFSMRFAVDESGGRMYPNDGFVLDWEETVVEDDEAYRREIDESPVSRGDVIGARFHAITVQNGCGAAESTVVLHIHHVLIDDTSFVLLRSKVERACAGVHVQAGPSFADFSLRLHSLQQQHRQAAVEFWAQKSRRHASAVAQFQLPTFSHAAAGLVGTDAPGRLTVQFRPDRLAKLSRRVGVSVASLHHAAWALVLSRFADSPSVCFGTVLSGRSLPVEHVQSVIGPTLNTLPLHVDLPLRAPVEDYLRSVFNSLLELDSYQWTTPAHGFKRVFESALSVRLEPPRVGGASPDLKEKPRCRVSLDYPLAIDVETQGDISLCYDSNALAKPQVKRLGAALVAALDAITMPRRTVASCLEALVDSQQVVDLCRMGNWTSESSRFTSVQDDLVSLFAQAAATNAPQVAVEHVAGQLTYAQLDQRSSLVARRLSGRISPGDVVCVDAECTPNWIVAIYSVLKAGAIYCPLDPSLPAASRNVNYSLAGAKLYLAGSSAAMSTRPSDCALALSVDELLMEHPDSSGDQQGLQEGVPRPRDSAYMCFTSGSTGRPKAVVCRHAGLVAFQRTFHVRLCARPGWRIAQFMSPAFDGSIHEIFSALSYGATLVLKDPAKPFSHLGACDAAVMTPSVARVLDMDQFTNLKAVYLVGEAVPQSVCDTWASRFDVYNMYGPSEGTCGATTKKLVANRPVTLGTPNKSTRLYILDHQAKLTPRGVVGEIYLAGVQVAAGYLGLPEVTEERFLQDSVAPGADNETMYRTGDRGYWDERGELVFVGRNDRQIKLRGFRIDLDDLGSRITMASDDCTASVVALKDNELVALVQPAGLDLGNLQQQLRQHLPAYVVPRHLAAVASFPLTPVGKLDYKTISAMVFQGGGGYGVISLAAEHTILDVLMDVLRISRASTIDTESSFADLGGDSFHALILSNRLSGMLKQRVQLRTVLFSATIRHMIEAVAPLVGTCAADRDLQELGDTIPSPIEAEWWRKHRRGGSASPAFNVSSSWELLPEVRRDVLQMAWDVVLERHSILRCRFVYSPEVGDVVRQQSQTPPVARLVDDVDVDGEINRPFDLCKDDLVRVLISGTRLLVVMSHIICDLTSLQVLLGEVADLYRGTKLGAVAKTYFQTAWRAPLSPEALAFWSQWLPGTPVDTFMSIGRCERRRTTWRGSSFVREVPAKTHGALLDFTAERRITKHQMALAAVALALQHDSSTCDITLGAPYVNRRSDQDMGVVGLFLEPLPIRIQYPARQGGALDLDEAAPTRHASQSKTAGLPFIAVVQRASRAALSHAVPWTQLLEHLKIETDFPNHPIFDVMVTFHEAAHAISLPIAGTKHVATWSEGAKFKLMAEFSAHSDGHLQLRLEYSDECFTRGDIELLSRLIMTALEGLMEGLGYDALLSKVRASKTKDY